MKSILFIYKKGKTVKALDLDDGDGRYLIKQGFKHVSTVNMKTFVEHIFNDVPKSEMIKVLNSLVTNEFEITKHKQNRNLKPTKDKFGDELKCICGGTFAYHCPRCGLP